ncbi:MAG: gamma-glutamyltransferase [Xanthobacteraceae bacterium]
MVPGLRVALLAVTALLLALGLPRELGLAREQSVALPAPAVAAPHGMVSSQEKRATRIGVEILRRGGNAVDAAVAIGFALAVTYPQAGNIGGGGFMLVHLAERHETVAIDYRETAPRATARDVFLDDKGEADPQKSRDSGLGIGVPGTVAGLWLAHERYGSGRLGFAELIEPAIRLARDGFAVEDELADSLPRAQPRLVRWPSSARIFLKPDGVALGDGDRLLQPELAASLELIAREGPGGFYQGALADKIVASVRGAGGLMTLDDLKDFRAVVRPALTGSYRGYDIFSMPPPSSGGVHLVEMLNVLEGYDLSDLGYGSPAALHLMIEAMKRAYADRAEFMGDPDAVGMPIARLTSKAYAAELRAAIDPGRTRPSREIRAGHPAPAEGRHTTHFSVIDQDGNAVANTYTLNLNYGVGLVADGTGILLNDELDDFAAKPGAPNAFGLVGGAANEPGPGKRPLSSMTPTIVLKDGKPYLVTGTPGGSRIITIVLQIVTDVIDRGMDIASAVSKPRVHNQWMPDQVIAEPGFAPDVIAALRARGDTVVVQKLTTSANSIVVTPGGFVGAADPRTRGALAAGY